MAFQIGGGGELRSLDVIVAGEIYADLILSGFDFWPRPGTEAFAREYHREIGGGTSITACGLARLGSQTGIFGMVGSDWGAWVIERLRENGVETAGLIQLPSESTGFSVVVSGSEDRAIFTYTGANTEFPTRLRDASRSTRFAQARHVHLAFCPPLDTASELLDGIRRSGCTVSLDVGWHENWLRDTRALAILPQIDLFFPNEAEAYAMTGQQEPELALARFRDAGAHGVAAKLGAAGAVLLWQGQIMRTPPHPVAPVDTCGAGDCFDAGFLHYWLGGASPRTCLQAANICGGLSVQAHGGLSGFPSAARLKEILEQTCER